MGLSFPPRWGEAQIWPETKSKHIFLQYLETSRKWWNYWEMKGRRQHLCRKIHLWKKDASWSNKTSSQTVSRTDQQQCHAVNQDTDFPIWKTPVIARPLFLEIRVYPGACSTSWAYLGLLLGQVTDPRKTDGTELQWTCGLRKLRARRKHEGRK